MNPASVNGICALFTLFSRLSQAAERNETGKGTGHEREPDMTSAANGDSARPTFPIFPIRESVPAIVR
jgi:hypothetical protein